MNMRHGVTKGKNYLKAESNSFSYSHHVKSIQDESSGDLDRRLNKVRGNIHVLNSGITT